MKRKINDFFIDRRETIKQAMHQLSEVGSKQLFVVDANMTLIGALSDGDIRKWILKGGSLRDKTEKICNKNPIKVTKHYVRDFVRETMLRLKIQAIAVVDERNTIVDILTWENIFAGKLSTSKEQLTAFVVIMAGGKGTRLDPFTRILPKPLIPVGDKPVIEVIMDNFSQYGIKDFFISVNHKSRMIKSYFEEMNAGYHLTYVEENKPLGTVGSLKLLEGRIKDSFFVTNCDVLIDVDYAELLHFHQDMKYDLTIIVSCKHYVIPYGVCEIEKGGILKVIREKPEHDLLVNTGLYLMNKKIVSLIPKNKFFNFTDLVLKAKKKGLRIGAFPIPERSWIDVGQWDEYYKGVPGFIKNI